MTALINATMLARTEPALFIIEDAHWIDAVSESMLADFLTVIPRTPSMVLITSRPEYEGALTRVHGAQTIALGPLGDSDTAALLGELLGSDPSVGELAAIIAERAAGNPFFAEEMVRELAQRGVLAGERGGYVCRADVAEVSVPATVQAAIEARIDRLSTPAKRTLNAASVIGARFEAELLAALGIDAVLDELLGAELIDQVRFTPSAEYAFHHPLIRAVAYESQLKSDRAQWHRRLAAAIQEREPGSVEENAALIAEHLEAAGELHAAYGWHMRAGAWSTNRDVVAARVSWERARRIADALPADDPDQLSMRIAPRTMLCATDCQDRAVQESRGRFAELRELCSAAGDKVSLAIGMTGLATELLYAGRSREGSRLASEQMALLESIGDPTLTMGLASVAFGNWVDAGEFGEILRWSQTVIDLAGVIPPRAPASVWDHRWRSRWHFAALLGGGWAVPGGAKTSTTPSRWPDATTRQPSPLSSPGPTVSRYGYGVLRADDSAVRASEEAVQTAQGPATMTQCLAEYRGWRAAESDAAADRHRGLELMVQVRESGCASMSSSWSGHRTVAARERARRGDRDAAIPVMRQPWTAAPAGRSLALGHRRSGGDAAGAWRRGRPGRSPRGDRPVGQPAGR